MDLPRTGETAPALRLEGDDGRTHDLHHLLRTKRVVVVFLDRIEDDATALAIRDFERAKPIFDAKNLTALFVLPETPEVLSEYFRERPSAYPLLADPDGLAARIWGVPQDDPGAVMDEEHIRASILVEKGGRVLRSFPAPAAAGHAFDVERTIDADPQNAVHPDE